MMRVIVVFKNYDGIAAFFGLFHSERHARARLKRIHESDWWDGADGRRSPIIHWVHQEDPPGGKPDYVMQWQSIW